MTGSASEGPQQRSQAGATGWIARLRDMVAHDETHAMPYFGLTNVFWVFAFVGNHLRAWAVLVLVVIALVAAAMFTAVPLGAQMQQRTRTAFFLTFLVPFLAALPVLHGNVLFLGTYVGMAGAVLLPLVPAVTVPLGAGALMAWWGYRLGSDGGVLFTLGCTAAMMGVTMAFSVDRARRERRLAEAQQRNAVLAVAAERARIGRDLHDILGHSLTAIAMKGDLASRLVIRDPDAARAQIDDLVTVARQALNDTRATASGLHEVRVASEIASARSVLEATGVTAHTPSALPVLDDATAELFGYVVREGVTNVVRHAAATQCWIVVDDQCVSVTDDGVGPRAGRRDGLSSGLTGLAGRAEAAGFDVRFGVVEDAEGRPRTQVSCRRTALGELSASTSGGLS